MPEHAPNPEATGMWEPIRFSLNDTPIELLRVSHRPETYEQNQKLFENSISKAGLVVLEPAPTAQQFDEKKLTQALSDALNEFYGKKIPIDEAQKRISKDSCDFYSALENIAARFHKPLAIMDPSQAPARTFVEFSKRNSILKLAKIGIAAGGLLYNVAGAFERSSKIQKPTTKNLLTRREVLSAGMLTASAVTTASLMADSDTSSMSSESFVENSGRVGSFGPFSYEYLDCRNVAVAEGLDRITKQIKINGPIVVIYGAAHGRSIQKYIENPTERAIKLALYAPLRAEIPYSIKIYNHSESGWEPQTEISDVATVEASKTTD